MNGKAIPSLALLIAIAALFGYIRPTLNGSIATAKSAIAFDDQALAAAAQYQSEQTSLASARDAIDPQNLTRLTQFLPDSVDNVGLVLDLNALAARSGLSLSNIDVVSDASAGSQSGQNPSATDHQNPVGSISLTLSAAGTFNALQTFLNGVERSARLLDVQDLVVKGSDTGVYTYEMTIRLYWLR